MIAGQLSIMYGLQGPEPRRWSPRADGEPLHRRVGPLIEYGDADVMIAGGTEAAITPLGLGGFAAPKALSTRNDDPARASRPCDSDRDGFVLGEGAGMLVLEELRARARARARRSTPNWWATE